MTAKQLGYLGQYLNRSHYLDKDILIQLIMQMLRIEFYGYQEEHQNIILGKYKKLQNSQKQVTYMKQLIEKQENQSDISLKNKMKQALIIQKQEMKKWGILKYQISNNYNNLNYLFQTIHTLANFCKGFENFDYSTNSCENIKEFKPFLQYFHDVLELHFQSLQLQNQDSPLPEIWNVEKKNITKALWGLSIIDTPENSQNSVKILVNLLFDNRFEQNYNLNEADISILYSIIIYYSKEFPLIFNQNLVNKILNMQNNIQDQKLHKISMICLDVCKILKEEQIPYVIEMNIDNIFVDILIPKYIEGKQVIIDVHGYQHYFRNSLVEKGNSVLKKKILNAKGYHYHVIPIYEWELLEKQDKNDYIIKFLQIIKEQSQDIK